MWRSADPSAQPTGPSEEKQNFRNKNCGYDRRRGCPRRPHAPFRIPPRSPRFLLSRGLPCLVDTSRARRAAVRFRAAAWDAFFARADQCRPRGPSRRSSLPFPHLRRHVVVGVAAVFEHPYRARQFRQVSAGVNEMNSPTIAYASARIEPSRSLALPYGLTAGRFAAPRDGVPRSNLL